ncbi:MAG: hypothetical protein J6K44_04270 [Clostridia bacterium]|nr:hypothetical protein [Clostridia bacterium]
MDTREMQWEKLAKEATRLGGDGNAIVDAYHELYSVHSEKICSWLGALFEPEIGGFYYSNSARDNEYVEINGEKHYFLPDIESTNQATNMLLSTGMLESCMELPEWMRKKIVSFTSSLLSPEDGYIYHPQWGKNIRLSRRGRDLNWAIEMQGKFDFKLPYPTAIERLRESGDNPDKKAEIMENMPEHLHSKEAFLEYLNSLDWENKAYPSGNTVTAQGTQIVAAGLADVAVDFLNSIQRPESGSWGKYDGYEAVNGILKISGVYQQAKRAIPNALNTAMTAMDCLNLDVECEAVVWQYNAWYSIRNITDNLRRFGGEAGKRQAAEIVAECLRRAPEAIRSSAKKCLPFLCEDGAYSYTPGFSSCTSQAARVSLGLKEGDVNATVINCTGIIHNSLKALDLEDSFVPLFGRNGYEKFLAGVESVRNK